MGVNGDLLSSAASPQRILDELQILSLPHRPHCTALGVPPWYEQAATTVGKESLTAPLTTELLYAADLRHEVYHFAFM